MEHDSTSASSETKRCDCVVALGASAGGLAPLERFFANMPPGTGAAFVVIQHLSPDFKSLMKELLSSHTRFPVHRVEDGMELRADNVYLIPPKSTMTMTADRRLRLAEQERDANHMSFPIDRFFESVAEHMGNKAIGIVLSGTGSDGSRGARVIDDAGGVVMAEDPEVAQFDGMPRSVIATGVVRLTQPVDELAGTVYGLLKRTADLDDWRVDEDRDAEHAIVSEVVAILGAETDADFTHYRPQTIARRLARRMALVSAESPDAYVRLLATDADERIALRDDLLIGVTDFFRDLEAWEVLSREVIAKAFHGRDSDDTIRAWVTACSTGEEAYSLAVQLLEARRLTGSSVPIKIFATDIDRRSLDRAAMGVFPASAVARIGEELTERYFIRHVDGLQVSPELRETVIFAAHNLIRDAPFTRLDLVTCRNVLIYMQTRLQERVLRTLQFALRTGGTLFLGAAESAESIITDFEPINGRWKIFRKVRQANHGPPMAGGRGLAIPGSDRHLVGIDRPVEGAAQARLHSETVRLVMGADESGCFVIDAANRLLHAYTGAGKYLRVPDGAGTDDITKLVHPELGVPLSTAIHRARKSGNAVHYDGISLSGVPGIDACDICVIVQSADRDTPAVVLVRPGKVAPPPSNGAAEPLDKHTQERVADLERELQLTRENLQATIEELETTNEEQQATNEELLASNEQLQSTNEELQSVNEELYTVNAEHQSKISQLTELNADFEHLLAGTQIGMIFLAPDLTIRRFTPAATAVLRLSPIDTGRPISDLAHNLDCGDRLHELIDRTNRTGEPAELPATTTAGRSVRLRINPYDTGTGEQSGVVIACIDVTTLVRTESAVRQKNVELEELISTISHDLKAPIVTISSFAELLERSDGAANTEADRATHIGRIRDAARRAKSSIDDLLGFRRLSQEPSSSELIQLNELVEHTLDALRTHTDAANAEITIRPDLGAVVGDRERIAVAIENLICNAISHGAGDGPPTIEIGGSPVEGGAEIFVRDHGPGIDPDQTERLFRLFERGSASRGSGVGLAIVRRVAEQHGGRAWVEPTPGGGCTFHLTLRSPSSAEAEPKPTPNNRVHG